MKKFNTIYYLLFVLIIFGAFASMAQNDYGIKILGLVATSFCLLFLIEFVQGFQQKRKTDVYGLLELLSLIGLSAILAMRVFYIHFRFVEIVFGAAGVLLIAVYVRKIVQSWQGTNNESKVLAILLVLFQGSIVLYVVSMTSAVFLPSLTELSGAAAFTLMIAFIAISILNRNMIVGGERVSGLSYVLKLTDWSVVLAILFLLFTTYMGLTKIGALPKMYSDEFPRAYFELVKQAETGIEKPVNGKYKHEEFKEKYDRFVVRNSNTKIE